MSTSLGSREIVFIGGLHRSGTSLLHEILREHSSISGFHKTGVFKDEGQHLQSVYLPAKAFGGPGRFGFDQAAFMDENHVLATQESAELLFRQWSPYWDFKKKILIEKSPPNLVRARFLQALFPQCKFLIVLRHPLAVAYATKKWSHTSIPSLLEHSLRCYERFIADLPGLAQDSVYVLRYEDFVIDPKAHLGSVYRWIGVTEEDSNIQVRHNINEKYFSMWDADRRVLKKKMVFCASDLIFRFESRCNSMGYSMREPSLLSTPKNPTLQEQCSRAELISK